MSEDFPLCASCEQPIKDLSADCPCTPEVNVLKMADVAAVIMAAGVPCDWGQSGGNCATFYVGVPYVSGPDARYPNDEARTTYPVLCGVGWVGEGGECFIATDGDCCVGFDNDGETDPEYVTGPDVTAEDLAAVILRWHQRWIAPDVLAYWEARTHALALGDPLERAEDFAEWFSVWGHHGNDVTAEFEAYVWSEDE